MIYLYTSGGGREYHDWWIDKSTRDNEGTGEECAPVNCAALTLAAGGRLGE
jgi:hypothetical protein